MRLAWTVWAVFVTAIFVLACEGKTGPMGPPGEQGQQGEQGLQGLQGFTGPTGTAEALTFSLIEVIFTADDYLEEDASYLLIDSRMSEETVLSVYIKRFFQNTGDPYWMPFDQLAKTEGWTTVFYQVLERGIRFIDINRDLQNEIIVIAVTTNF